MSAPGRGHRADGDEQHGEQPEDGGQLLPLADRDARQRGTHALDYADHVPTAHGRAARLTGSLGTRAHRPLRPSRFGQRGGRRRLGNGRGAGRRAGPTPSPSPPSRATRSARSASPATGGRCPTSGCSRRSCPARSSRWARTTPTTRRRWAATRPTTPLIFLKPSTSVIGDGDAIRLPPSSDEVHYEGELAVVIGTPARNVAPSDALQHVFGYAAANDVTARDQQRADVQFTRAKGYDSFCPLGPVGRDRARPGRPARRHPRQRRGQAGRADQPDDPRRPARRSRSSRRS